MFVFVGYARRVRRRTRVGPPTASPLMGARVPWVSLPGPTLVLSDAQGGIGSRAPTLVVALCLWLRCVGGGGHVLWTLLIRAFYKQILENILASHMKIIIVIMIKILNFFLWRQRPRKLSNLKFGN